MEGDKLRRSKNKKKIGRNLIKKRKMKGIVY